MGCKVSRVSPSVKLPKSPSTPELIHKSPNDTPSPSKQQEKDIEALKNFNLMPAHFIRQNSGRITDDYTIHSPPIGKGSFGEVRRATHNASGLNRAIKIIARRHTHKDQEEVLLNEVSILKSLDHPQIMKVLEFYRDKHFFYIVSEYCSGGDLFERMRGTKFSESKAAKIMSQLITGVKYLHKSGIVHRDLKPENILYESTSDNAGIKIADFGVSRALKQGNKLHSTVGTVLYMAPEVLRNNYTEKCDIWSCGVILYTMLVGRPPFMGRNEAEVEDKITRGVYSFSGKEGSMISKEARGFIEKLLSYHPNNRYSADQALKDPWLVKILFQNKKLTNKNLKLGQEILTNLTNFQIGRKFQDAVWVFMANYFLAEKDKKQLIAVFQELDQDKDGLLTKEEVEKGFEKYNMINAIDEGGAEEVINRIDRNKNGSIDYSEFVIAAINKKKLLARSNLEATFKLIDKDGSKCVTADELKSFFAGQNNNEWDDSVWDALVREVDENSDGEISYVEFKNMMFNML